MKTTPKKTTWVHTLQLGDLVAFHYGTRAYSQEEAAENVYEVDAIYPQGLKTRKYDLTGRYIVVVDEHLFDEDGKVLGDVYGGKGEASITQLSAQQLEFERKRNLVEYLQTEMGFDDWLNVPLETLKLVYKQATSRDWEEE